VALGALRAESAVPELIAWLVKNACDVCMERD